VKIALLTIENFRGIQSGKVQFRDHTVLVGPNNCGKTTVIEALALMLGRDRLIRDLTEHDFFGSNPQPTDRIRFVATVTGFSSEDFTEHSDWFRDGRGVPVWFDPQAADVVSERTRDHQTLACQIAFAARFDRESLEVETARYFYDSDIDVFAEDSFLPVPAKLIREIGLFLIPASRSWDRMLSFGSELFRRVIRSASGLPAETILAERDRLREPINRLEEDERLKPVVDQVNAEIVNLLGVESPVRLRITGTDSDSVIECVTPHFATASTRVVPSKRQGSGMLSLQSLFLLLHFGQKRIEAGESFCMTLEEPELHLPPMIQRRVLSRLRSLSTQTIITTHSPLVAAFCDATSLLILRNENGRLLAKPMLERPLEQRATNSLRKLFQINRIETVSAMMNEYVLVPEGKSDFDWLNLLVRAVELERQPTNACLFGVQVGVVPTHDAKIKEACEVLSKSHQQIMALVDGDANGRHYVRDLRNPNVGVRRILRWPNDWTIEDVIAWIIEADDAVAMERINSDLATSPGDRNTLLARLKTNDHAQHGMKGDFVAHEIIANALADSPICIQRTSIVLQAIAQVCAGVATEHFEQVEAGEVPIFIFKPCP